jgi:hypothetical protein
MNDANTNDNECYIASSSNAKCQDIGAAGHVGGVRFAAVRNVRGTDRNCGFDDERATLAAGGRSGVVEIKFGEAVKALC